MIFLLGFSASPFSSDSGLGTGTGNGPGTVTGNGPGKGPEDGGLASFTGDFRMMSGVASRIGIGVVDSLFEESISVVILSSIILIGLDWK